MQLQVADVLCELKLCEQGLLHRGVLGIAVGLVCCFGAGGARGVGGHWWLRLLLYDGVVCSAGVGG